MDQTSRQRRHNRTRAKISGTADRPRVSVYRSANQVVVQLVDDEKGETIAAVNGNSLTSASKVAQAEAVGKQLAELAQAKGISRVVFDSSGYTYHGRVKAIAEGLRAGGLRV